MFPEWPEFVKERKREMRRREGYDFPSRNIFNKTKIYFTITLFFIEKRYDLESRTPGINFRASSINLARMSA